MNDVEVVLHRGAVSAADTGGEEEDEQHQSCRQPAARGDAEPEVSRSAGQHAGDSLRALQSTDGCSLSDEWPTRSFRTYLSLESGKTT